MDKPNCNVPSCEKPSKTRGMCGMHYERVRLGRPMPLDAPPTNTLNAGKTCSIDDCEKPSKTRGMCGVHAERVRQWGDPHKTLVIHGQPIARFWSKVDRRGGDECWPWLGTVLSDGYGQLVVDGRKVPAHRFAYELLVGPIPEGLQIDHVRARGCSRRDCVNPAHMEPVTLQENIARSDCVSAVNRRKTLCHNGHEFDAVVVRDGKVRRKCRTCFNEWQREYRRKRRAAGLV